MIKKKFISICLLVLIICALLYTGVSSYYSPSLLRSFHHNEDSFETLKIYLLKLGEKEGVDSWYPLNSTNKIISSRDEFQIIRSLTQGKKNYLIDNGRVFSDKKMVVFRYIRKGDDAEAPLLLIYTPNKKNILWYLEK